MLNWTEGLRLAAFFVLGGVAWLWVFFWLYLGAMATIRAYKEGVLTAYHWAICGPWLLVAWTYDVLSNIFIVSIIYLELPRQLTVTARLKLHIKNEGWRGAIARFLCKILSPFDPTGDHCD